LLLSPHPCLEHFNARADTVSVLLLLQACTGGITEFVPLPFVHMEAPIYLAGAARWVGSNLDLEFPSMSSQNSMLLALLCR
jgi:hypothetical protein